MSTWDDITGKTAAKQAEQYQAIAENQRNTATNVLAANQARMINGSEYILSLIQPILSQLSGSMVKDNATATEATRQAIDILLGRQTTPEQQQASQLTQNYIDLLTGKNKSEEQKTADQWNQNYLNLLQNSPDVAFNAGVSNLAQNLQAQKQNVANQMQKRGISGSGIDLAKIAGTQNDYYAGMSQMQGQRINNQLASANAGAAFAQGLADRAGQNYQQAVNAADTIAQRQIGNVQSAANIANSNKQNNFSNYAGLIGQMGNAYAMPNSATNALAGQYNTGANAAQQTADSYNQAAAGAASSLGGLAGTIVGGFFGPIGAAAGEKIGSKLFK